MKTLAFAFMLALLGLSLAANAQQAAPPAPAAGTLREACAADATALCPGMKPMDQRKCLMTNSSKVSQECGTALANAGSAMKAFRQACGADIRQYCAGQAPGPARHQCITTNTPQFSQACQTALAARAPAR